MSLSEVDNGKVVVIKAFNGGKRFVGKLNSMGIYEGMKVKILKHAPFSGPVLIQGIDNPLKIMIGRQMAQRIEVEVFEVN